MTTHGDNSQSDVQSPRIQNDASSAQEVVQSFMALVKQKCRGEITMMEAILNLLKTLLEGGSITAFSHYVKQLAEAKTKWVTTLK